MGQQIWAIHWCSRNVFAKFEKSINTTKTKQKNKYIYIYIIGKPFSQVLGGRQPSSDPGSRCKNVILSSVGFRCVFWVARRASEHGFCTHLAPCLRDFCRLWYGIKEQIPQFSDFGPANHQIAFSPKPKPCKTLQTSFENSRLANWVQLFAAPWKVY